MNRHEIIKQQASALVDALEENDKAARLLNWAKNFIGDFHGEPHPNKEHVRMLNNSDARAIHNAILSWLEERIVGKGEV